MTLTIKLPDTITRQIQERQISEKEIENVVLATLEIWLGKPKVKCDDRFTESAKPFIQRLITQNREIFEQRAQQ